MNAVRREFSRKANGTGEATLTAQSSDDLADLEALFPKVDGDGHGLAYEWESESQVRVYRRPATAAVTPTASSPAPAVTQASLEKLSKEDLETRAAELGVAVDPKESKARLAARVLEAIGKKAPAA
jgi:hypothetical protein